MFLGIILQKIADLTGGLSPATAEGLSRSISFFCWSVLRLRRRTVTENLRTAVAGGLALPLGIEGTARRAYDHIAMTAIEFLRGSRHDWSSGVEIAGENHIAGALSGGRGVYLLCAHQGNWEVHGAALSRLIRPAHILVKKVGSDQVNSFVLGMRRRNGFRDIERAKKGDAVRVILRALSAGDMVAFVMDQTRPGEPLVPFFGVPARTNTGLASLWRRHQAPVVPCWIERLEFGRHRLHFLPALDLSSNITSDAKTDIMETTRRFNEVLESIIGQRPEQYFWMHRRWKQ
jgi:KDO2-lipid IV(A) lauroyltransferase